MARMPRPNFIPGQLLTSVSLNAAQLYQIDLGREHRATAHLPGSFKVYWSTLMDPACRLDQAMRWTHSAVTCCCSKDWT